MTDPLNVTPNEVIARVSVDIPPDTEANLHQLRQSIDTLRAGVEAVSRATGDFYDHLSTLPEIAARAGAATQNLSESVAAGKDALGGPGGTGPNQNNAPSKFVDAFADGGAGTGQGRLANTEQAQAYLDTMAQQDPRMYANYMSARGMPMAPSQVAEAAMAPSPGQIEVPGATPPAPARSSTAPITQGGTPRQGPDDLSQIPAQAPRPGPASQDPAQQLLNEQLGPGNVGMPAPGGAPGGGGGGGGMPGLGGAGAAAGALNWLNGKIPGLGLGAAGTALGAAGAIGTAVAVAAALYKITQMVGEQVARLTAMGGVQGGGFSEGLADEASIRRLAMSPYINQEQARDMYQTMRRSGYRGKDLKAAERLMTDNLTSMGMSAGQTQGMLDQYEGGPGERTRSEAVDAVRTQLAAERALSRDSSMSVDQVRESNQSLTQYFTESGVDAVTAGKVAGGYTSMFSSTPGMQGVMALLQMNFTQAGLQWVLRENGLTASPGNEKEVIATNGGAKLAENAVFKLARQMHAQMGNMPDIEQRLRFSQRLTPYVANISREVTDKLWRQALKLDGKDPEGTGKFDKKPSAAEENYGLPRGSEKAGNAIRDNFVPNLDPSKGPINLPVPGSGFSVQFGPEGFGLGGPVGEGVEAVGGVIGGAIKRSFGNIIDGFTEPFGIGGEGEPQAAGAGSGGRGGFVPSNWKPGKAPSSDYAVTEGEKRKVTADVRPVSYETPMGPGRNDGTHYGSENPKLGAVLQISADPRLLKALGLPESINLTQNHMQAMSGWGRTTVNNPPPGDR